MQKSKNFNTPELKIFPLQRKEEIRGNRRLSKIIISVNEDWWSRYEKVEKGVNNKKIFFDGDLKKINSSWNIGRGDYRVSLTGKDKFTNRTELKEKILKYSLIPAVVAAVLFISLILGALFNNI